MSEDGAFCRHCDLPVPAGLRSGDGPWFCCFGCRFAYRLALPAAEAEKAGGASPPPNTLLLRLGLGVFLAINIMVFSWLGYSREVFGAAATGGGYGALAGLFSYLTLFLCTLVMVLLGVPLLADSWRRLVARGPSGGDSPTTARLDAQLLIVIGVFAAYLLSAIHTLRGEGSLYFDTAAMVLVIVTLGSYLDAGAKRRAAAAATQLLASLPTTMWVRRGDGAVEVAGDVVEPGDLVRVRPGETVPVDGIVDEGSSRVAEASLTGESQPRAVEPGDRLLAGTVSLDGQLWVRAEKVGDDTVVALMERSLAQARGLQPPVQRLADRVAAIFVPGVLLLAIAVFALGAWRGDWSGGMLTALSVLLISCPCALGLAAPLASWHALRRAAEQGILIDSPATLELAATVEQLFLDKTGTLTRPEPAVNQAATVWSTLR